MSKLNKVKKWAQEKGFKVEEISYSQDYRITIDTDTVLKFEVSEKDSTLVRNIKGKYNGHAKGVYLAIHQKEGVRRFGYDFQYPSQTVIVEEMERALKKQRVKE